MKAIIFLALHGLHMTRSTNGKLTTQACLGKVAKYVAFAAPGVN